MIKKEFDESEFGKRLKQLRNERKIGQNKLSKDLNISNASISYWENGLQEPTASALFKIAQYFNVSIDYLIGLKDYNDI